MNAKQEDAAAGTGRQASSPDQMPARAWGAILMRVWYDIGRDHLSIIAAGVAFFAVLAMFPAIAALIAVYGLVADPHQVYATLPR